jgi:hypothetical protein
LHVYIAHQIKVLLDVVNVARGPHRADDVGGSSVAVMMLLETVL